MPGTQIHSTLKQTHLFFHLWARPKPLPDRLCVPVWLAAELRVVDLADLIIRMDGLAETPAGERLAAMLKDRKAEQEALEALPGVPATLPLAQPIVMPHVSGDRWLAAAAASCC